MAILIAASLQFYPLQSYAGGCGSGGAGWVCGQPVGQLGPGNRQFIPDRDLIWDWTKWQRSWGESKREFFGLPGFRHLGQGAAWAHENIAAVRDISKAVAAISQGIVGFYGENIFDPMTSGMGGFTPFEEAMKSQAEAAAVVGPFGAAFAAGGALGTAARIIGEGLTGGMTPAFVTSTGSIIPGSMAPAATGFGGAGIGMGIGGGFGLGERAIGINQAEMSLEEAGNFFRTNRQIRSVQGRGEGAAKVFNPQDPTGALARSTPGALPTIRDIIAASAVDLSAIARLQQRGMRSLEGNLAGWMAVDSPASRNSWRILFRHHPQTGNIEYRLTQHYAR